MGQSVKLSHPMMRSELKITQSDADPKQWSLTARGHNSVNFTAETLQEAMQVAPNHVINLRRVSPGDNGQSKTAPDAKSSATGNATPPAKPATSAATRK